MHLCVALDHAGDPIVSSVCQNVTRIQFMVRRSRKISVRMAGIYRRFLRGYDALSYHYRDCSDDFTLKNQKIHAIIRDFSVDGIFHLYYILGFEVLYYALTSKRISLGIFINMAIPYVKILSVMDYLLSGLLNLSFDSEN